PGKRLELGERVVEGVALVDDAVQSGLGGDFELLPENVGLLLFVTRVVGRRCWWGETIDEPARGDARPTVRAAHAWQAVIIQADFSDGDDFGMLAHFAQGRAEVGWRFQGVGRMPADGGVNGREFFGEA